MSQKSEATDLLEVFIAGLSRWGNRRVRNQQLFLQASKQQQPIFDGSGSRRCHRCGHHRCQEGCCIRGRRMPLLRGLGLPSRNSPLFAPQITGSAASVVAAAVVVVLAAPVKVFASVVLVEAVLVVAAFAVVVVRKAAFFTWL